MPDGAYSPTEPNYTTSYGATYAVLNGFAVSAPTGEQSFDSGLQMNLDVTGAGQFLLSGKAGDMSPAFDNMTIPEVIEYINGIAGFAYDSSHIEDLSPTWNQQLNVGVSDTPFWQCDDGMAWGDFLKEVFMYSGFAGLYVQFNDDGHPTIVKCCPHCLTYRNGDSSSPDYFMNHLDNGPASTGCLARDKERTGNDNGVDFYVAASGPDAASWGLPHDQLIAEYPEGDVRCHVLMSKSIAAPTLAVEDEYYNRVTVKGVHYALEKKEPRTSVATDWASVHGSGSSRGLDLGREKNLLIGPIPWANREAIRNYLTYVHYRRVSRRPEHIEVTVPFTPAAGIGKVFGIVGGSKLGVNGKKYRIKTVSHSGVSQDNFDGPTTMEGVYIGTMSPPGESS